jgi:hypothetical protein
MLADGLRVGRPHGAAERPLAVMTRTLLRPSSWHWCRSTRPSRSRRSTSRQTLYWASCVRSCTPDWRSMPFGARSTSRPSQLALPRPCPTGDSAPAIHANRLGGILLLVLFCRT